MIISNLLTKYILASFWIRILIALLFYLVVRQLHFIDADFDFGVAECMPRKKSAKILSETKEEIKQSVPAVAESKDQIISRLERQVKDLTSERTGLRRQVSKIMKNHNQFTKESTAQIQKLQGEIDNLRLNDIVPEATEISLPSIAYAEPVAEISSIDVTAVSLENENIHLRNELQEVRQHRQNLFREVEEYRSLKENFNLLKKENAYLQNQIQDLFSSRQNLIKVQEQNAELRSKINNISTAAHIKETQLKKQILDQNKTIQDLNRLFEEKIPIAESKREQKSNLLTEKNLRAFDRLFTSKEELNKFSRIKEEQNTTRAIRMEPSLDVWREID
jgi:DNA repair exonuclease SbcCD ATPase subunit